MGTEDPKDPLKWMDWKNLGGSVQNETSIGPVTKKRLLKKIRQIPDRYVLPRRSIPSAIAFYGGMDCCWSWCRDAVGNLDKQESQGAEVSFGSLTNKCPLERRDFP